MIAAAYRALTPAAHIAGIDEAGRGPLAGPLLVAAVVLDPHRVPAGLADSKRLSERQREALFEPICASALAYAIVAVSAADIDRLNIYQATLHGMREAAARLQPQPQLALVDGNRVPQNMPCASEYRIRGDALEPAISAASILAKVSRDRLLRELDQRYPHYGFATHKGYPTAAHLAALRQHGPCPEHRRSFAPVRAALANAPTRAGETVQPGLL